MVKLRGQAWVIQIKAHPLAGYSVKAGGAAPGRPPPAARPAGPLSAHLVRSGPMTYKTVLVHVDDSSLAAGRIRAAAAIARHWNGHLVGAAFTGIARFIYGS